MKRRIIMPFILLLALFQQVLALDLQEQIKALPDVISVEKMENNPLFSEAYVIMIRQPLDHNQPGLGSFPQRIILSHLGYNEPVVFVTEGYNADSEVGPRYLNELCPMLYANQLFVEHRFFGKSVPQPMQWKYLTVENASADYHHILKIFKQIYPGNWLSTGISKGGQGCLYYRLLYPEDVSETVAYVAPLNYSYEDKRHDRFIRHKAGTAEQRREVMNFQKEVLRRKSALLPLFDAYCNQRNYVFAAPIGEIYDYCVLEYSFSFWQWGHSTHDIPGHGASDQQIFSYFVKVISPDYFDRVTGRVVLPFFVQAHRELGYYAYNPKPFHGLMQLKNTHGYLTKLFVPKEAVFPYSRKLSNQLQKYLKHRAEHILLIYGENDPWSASAAKTGRNKKITKLVMKDGSHMSRINALSSEQQSLANGLLKKWMMN